MRHRWLTAVAALALATAPLTGCGGASNRPDAGRPGSVPVASTAAAGPTVSSTPNAGGPTCLPPGTASSAAGPLADVQLQCLAGGQPVRLGGLGRPAVINLWASWCGPCREELPAFQRYAVRAAGAVLVIGVATEDTLPAARSLVDDLGLTFPMLFDREAAVRKASGRVAGLPVTIFLDAGGAVVHVYNGRALDEAGLAGLVEQHLGVRR